MQQKEKAMSCVAFWKEVNSWHNFL